MSKYEEYVRINPSKVLQKTRPDINKQIYSENFDEETSIFRKLCLLPFEPIWYYFVIIIGLVNSIVAILNCIHAISGNKGHRILDIFYTGDIIWCINTSLLLCDKYILDLKTTQIIIPRRRIVWFIIDYVSVIPIELFISDDFQAYLALNKTLKIVYIMFLFHYVNSMLESKIVIRLFQLICLLMFFIALVSLIFTVILYNFDKNPERHNIKDIVYIVADHMSGKGFGSMAMEHYMNKFLVNTSTLILFVGLIVLCTAYVTFLFFTESAEKNAFRYKLNCLINQIKRNKLNPQFIECLEIVFDTLWTQARGVEKSIGGRRLSNQITTPEILSKTFFAEITIDMCTGIFKHSMLLKELPVAFLRDLSLCVTYEVYVKNQLICKLNEPKDKMIYIHKGFVEIISDEDGETPMMKLASGTCLSEVCLYLPYKSNFLVRCGDTCTFHIIRWTDFQRLARKFPAIHSKLRERINERLQEAKTLKQIQDLYNKRADRIQKCTNLSYLLYVLHKLTANAHPHVAAQHTLANLLLERIINEDRFRNHIFSPCYLTLYAVPEERQDYNDTLFAKSTFPYVFKPDTGLTLFWEIFIGFLALVAALVIPYFACVAATANPSNLPNTVYFFTVIWFIDIIIQLRISIIYGKKIVSGFLDILIMKLTSIMFLLDIASVLPVEIFAALFVFPRNQNYVYMNRILKLSRVMRLLARWEGRYNSNPLHVRFVCAILFIVYSIFIISCIFAYMGYQEISGKTQFEVLLFYTSQILTGVSVWVEGYSNLRDYHLVNIVLYLIVCAVYSVLYGMIFSAYASVQLNILSTKHNTSALIAAAIPIDQRYEYYIHDAMSDIITVDNGFTIQNPEYFYNTMPKEFVGYFFKTCYEHHVEGLPMFDGIPKLVLREIFEEGGTSRNYTADEVIFHVGDILDDLLLLMSGTCEVIDGVSLASTFVEAVRELNSVEVGLILPMRTTVVTHTHCRILNIKYSVMRRVLYKRASMYSVRGQLSGMRDIRARIMHARLQYFNPELMDNRKKSLPMQSHVFFNRVNPSYLRAYTDSGLLKMRWMFMNLSFCPGGKFLQMWEIVRCVCAVSSALFFTSITLCFYKVPHPIAIFKWALEVMAFIDIYIRLHVAYYNEQGILVTHPGKTIIYYIKHGLLIDLLAALPLHVFITRAEYIVLNVNKILQLHRYVSFMRYKRLDKVVPLSKVYMCSHIPILLVCLNVMASSLLLFNCSVDMSDPYNAQIDCEDGSIFDFKDNKLTSPTVAHVHAIYMVLSIISKIAVQGFTVTGNKNRLFISIMSFIGFCMDAVNAARVFGYFLNTYVDMMYNDLRMKILKGFIFCKDHKHYTNHEHVKLAVNHIKREWNMNVGNVHKHTKDCPLNLRRDIFFNKFSPILIESLLNGANGIEGLIRNLLVRSEYKIFDRHGIVQRVNDIGEYTIIIFSGIVFIDVNEDLETQITSCVSLGPGSIIGNVCPLQYNRLKVTLIALSAMELLCIKTNTFFEILQHFPDCQDEFLQMRRVHITHVPGKSETARKHFDVNIHKRNYSWKIKKCVRLAFIFLNLLNFVGGYIPQIIYFHDIITVNIYGNLYHLITDGCYVMAIILVFFLPITNEKGELMTTKDIIQKFFKPWMFYISILGSIPFYVFIPDLDKMLTFYIIAASRLNVLLRNFFLFKIINTSIELAPSMMFALKFIANILIIILSIGATTALLIFISDLDKLNMNPRIKLKTILNAPSQTKNEHLVNYVYIVTNMYTHTSQPFYYPVGFIYIIVFIIMMSIVMVYNTVIYATFVSMVQSIEQLKHKYVTEKRLVQALMLRSDTSSILDDRLDFYCRMTWKSRKGNKIPELFLQLPPYLREAMSEDLFARILNEHEFFGQVHYDLRRQIYSRLKLEYYYHGDFIAYEGTIEETMYFIHKGTVVSLLEGGTVINHTLEAGQSFALMQGITDNLPHDLSYRSVSDSIILTLAKTDWDYLLHFYPASKKIIFTIAESLYKEHQD